MPRIDPDLRDVNRRRHRPLWDAKNRSRPLGDVNRRRHRPLWDAKNRSRPLRCQ
ncbi:hypothetical protein DPMN_118683 [Dreissena polymorpha]|uniref:Uncharacterized protein n=1 Tax=Dreissena polymorpha TaxID=45954 RepID=A0A9D4GKL3_DREPO|nr:hypothetical protein DPMN_118683 [Dreissena polymorpha]